MSAPSIVVLRVEGIWVVLRPADAVVAPYASYIDAVRTAKILESRGVAFDVAANRAQETQARTLLHVFRERRQLPDSRTSWRAAGGKPTADEARKTAGISFSTPTHHASLAPVVVAPAAKSGGGMIGAPLDCT